MNAVHTSSDPSEKRSVICVEKRRRESETIEKTVRRKENAYGKYERV